MGQYYMPCSLTSNKENVKSYVYSHHIKSRWKTADGRMVTSGQGLKLMEHSYLKNKMMLCVEALLIEGGEWNKTPIVWAGDYSDAVRGDLNYYSMCDSTDEGEHVSRELIPKPLTLKQAKEFRFIVNHIPNSLIRFPIPFHIRLSHVPINSIVYNRINSLITFLINSTIKRCYIQCKYVNLCV